MRNRPNGTLSLFHRRADSLGNAGGQIVLVFSGFGVDHLAYGLHLTLLTVRPVGGLHHGLLQLWVALLTPLHPLQQAGQQHRSAGPGTEKRRTEGHFQIFGPVP